MNPLQRALKFQLSTQTLALLMNRFTINHRDAYRRTPVHYVIEEYRESIDSKKKLLAVLVEQGADLYAQDIDNRTALTIAQSKAPELNAYLLDLMNQEGTIRYPPFHSYAEFRENINVEYFIDGEKTYLAMAESLRKAKKCVYMCDWWMTPEVTLDRRGKNPDEWVQHQLDNILKELAEKGVQIRVLLWDNVEMVESLGSSKTQTHLEDLHENIKVMRHSSSATAGMSHHQKIIVVDEYLAFVGGLDICSNRWDTQSHPIVPSDFYPGKDFYNPRFKSTSDFLGDHLLPYKLLSERNLPRMPWHDITFRVDGHAAFDVSVNFVQRWNFIRAEFFPSYPFLVHPSNEFIPSFPTKRSFKTPMQVTRSVGKWSIGYRTREQSIFNAIRHAITTSESYVYIETQFFISIQENMELSEDPMSLSDVIVNRIRRAVRENKKFKCIIVLPMYPEGNPADDVITQRIMYWQLKTINYIEDKVREFTRGFVAGPADYIKFYSLANTGLVEGTPYMEQIYVHAKLLITDTMAICGSANLNMRSLMGDRDSEICVVVTHCPEFCEQLRTDLWKEHLGTMLFDEELQDS